MRRSTAWGDAAGCFHPTVSLPVERFSRASVIPASPLAPASILAMQLAHRAPLTSDFELLHAIVAAANIARQVVGDIGGPERQGHGTHSLRVASNGAFLAELSTIRSQDPRLTFGQFRLIGARDRFLEFQHLVAILVGGMAKLSGQGNVCLRSAVGINKHDADAHMPTWKTDRGRLSPASQVSAARRGAPACRYIPRPADRVSARPRR